MIARLACGSLQGVDALRVDLEVDLARQGMPAFTLVGLAEGAVRESKERVFAALRAADFKLPPARITVNLAPADRRKAGTAYDLPLALGLLAAADIIGADSVQGWFFAAELSLSGELKPVSGVLPLALLARQLGAKGLMTAPANADEAAVVQGLTVLAPRTLAEAAGFFAGRVELSPTPVPPTPDPQDAQGRPALPLDFAEVKGQMLGKRALEIAAAGGHNVLLMGPPGSGKTMLAQRLPTILPPLSFDESLEVTKIYSVAGRLRPGQGRITIRPFRAPHHTISDIALIGGGGYPRPGEVSLAHSGVLFLDEFPEFRKSALEVLRQPLEDGVVSIARAAESVVYPAQCMLVAAMNPCPCGYSTDPVHTCTCTPAQIARYTAKLSGPLLDRIDLHVEVPAVPYEDLRAKTVSTGAGYTEDFRAEGSSARMRKRVLDARHRQAERYAGSVCRHNAMLSGALLERHCALDNHGHGVMERTVRALGLSARSYTRILRLARTIADLEGGEHIRAEHLQEAVALRVLDREK